jgi:microcystin-dependent protein
LLCDGTVYDRSQHPGLFGVIGTAYNTGGESSVQFRVPDYRNAVAIGPGDYALGAAGGSKDSVLPAHTHDMGAHLHDVNNHSHPVANHSHTVNDHGHSINHNHGAATTSKDGAHSHDTIENNYGADGSVAGFVDYPGWVPLNGLTLRGGQTFERGVTSKGSSHSHSYNLPNFTGSSGGATPGTNSNGPGSTNSKTGLKTAETDGGQTSSKGVAPDGLNYPPFMTANKIIKAV